MIAAVHQEHLDSPGVPAATFGVLPTASGMRLLESGVELGGCFCFVGGTRVSTAHGSIAIDEVHVGDQILAENPAKGTVEPEPVLATIDDGIKPLLQVDLSDGSALRVTSNHPFFVDPGSGLPAPGWQPACQR